MIAAVVCTSTEQMPDGRPTGVYASELVEAWNGLTDAGYQTHLLSPRGGAVPVEARRHGHADEDAFFAAEGGRAVAASVRVDEGPQDLDLVFVVGGHGAMMDLARSPELGGLLRRTHDGGGVVGAVCHGVSALLAPAEGAAPPLVQGRRVAGFSDEEEAAVGMMRRIPWLLSQRLRHLGANVDVGPAFLPHHVVDGRLVTGQNPASAHSTVRATLRAARQTVAPVTRR